MTDGQDPLRRELAARIHTQREQGLYREYLSVERRHGPHADIGGKRYLSFCDNDYLGLGQVPITADVSADNVGAGASPTVIGRQAIHRELAAELAAFLGVDDVLLFNCGYMANLAAFSALCDAKDIVFPDRLSHASLLDGVKLSRARFRRFRHRDVTHLTALLGETERYQKKWVVTESVFSMDGNIAPLQEIAATAKRHRAALLVDDAHGFGVLHDGRGAVGGGAPIDLITAGLGKAPGIGGGFIAGDATLIEGIAQFARPYIYSTAPSPLLVQAIRHNLRKLIADRWRREKLAENIDFFRTYARQAGLAVIDSTTPIQAWLLQDAEAALHVDATLFAQGIVCRAMRPPTVPNGMSRLRIGITALHEREHIKRLIDACRSVMASS